METEIAVRGDPECAGEQHVVAELGMHVERQVGGVHRNVVFDEELQTPVPPGGDRYGSVPEKSVMNQQQVAARRGSLSYGLGGCVDGGRDLGHLPRILDLETIPCRRIINDLRASQCLVEIENNIGKIHDYVL